MRCNLNIFILCILVVALSFKVYLLRKAAREIREDFEEKVQSDTNTLVHLSSRDRAMCELAEAVNDELRKLREERNRFRNGDAEVRNAITNISHDIRTPLAAILGYVELLQDEEVPENVASYIRIIQNRAELLQKLTEELFDYSIDVSSDAELKDEAVDVKRILQESIANFYVGFTERGIEPEIDITENPVVCRGDSDTLERVFQNLLGNALKYSDGDLKIVLSDSGELTFSNHAAKLDSVEVGRLFDRFYTVENARQSHGLGLSIAKLFVERMGGSISADYLDGQLIIKMQLRDRG